MRFLTVNAEGQSPTFSIAKNQKENFTRASRLRNRLYSAPTLLTILCVLSFDSMSRLNVIFTVSGTLT